MADEGEFVVVELMTPALERSIRELRRWHARGHTEGCACRPCGALRAELASAEVLDVVYRFPVRDEDALGRCVHGVDTLDPCEVCDG